MGENIWGGWKLGTQKNVPINNKRKLPLKKRFKQDIKKKIFTRLIYEKLFSIISHWEI